MKYTIRLALNRNQLQEMYKIVSFGIIQRHGDQVKVEFNDEVHNIQAALILLAPALELKIFNAKIAIEALVEEVQQYHGCKGYGTSKAVLIPLEFEDGDVCDHFSLFRNDKKQGLQVTSYEYDWIDPEQE